MTTIATPRVPDSGKSAYFGRRLRIAWALTGVLGVITIVGYYAGLPLIWAFSGPPAGCLLAAALVISFDYLTAHTDGRARMLYEPPSPSDMGGQYQPPTQRA
ncbi:MAG: hypothetical protein M3T56_09335 [Chloroflexota bacterium]|nr:hypothetical protein [Chloroflexota bacterium]